MTVETYNEDGYNTKAGPQQRTPSPTNRAGKHNLRSNNPNMPLQFKVRQFSASPNNISDDEQRSNTPNGKVTPRSKGLNVFAVSPLGARNLLQNQYNGSLTPQLQPGRRSSVLSNNTTLPLLSESDDETPSTTSQDKKSPISSCDLELPLDERLLRMSIDEQLRILALKEMAIVQIKDQIQSLNKKLHTQEGELHKLREVVQKSLYQEISGAASNTRTNRQRTNSNPRDQAIETIRAKRRSSSGALQQEPNNEESGKPSKLWSGLTKPLNMLQQFDTMIQNEFEKSLVLDKEKQQQTEQKRQQQQHLQRQRPRDHTRVSHQLRSSEDSIASTVSISSPLQSRAPQSLSEYRGGQDRQSDDMIQSVSASIWSFVNEVKQNVLSSLSEEDLTVSNDFDVDDQSIDFSMYKR